MTGAADDLEILNPDRLLLLDGEEWRVREYSHLEQGRLFALGRAALAGIGRAPPDLAPLVAMIAIATGRDELAVGALPDDDFEALRAAWKDLNTDLFTLKPKGKGKPERWSVVYAQLISAGHPLKDLRSYTNRQINLFLKADRTLRNRARRESIFDVNAATAGGKPAEKLADELAQED